MFTIYCAISGEPINHKSYRTIRNAKIALSIAAKKHDIPKNELVIR